MMQEGEYGEIYKLAGTNAQGMRRAAVKQRRNGGYRIITATGKTAKIAREALEAKMGRDVLGPVQTMNSLCEAYLRNSEKRGFPKPRTRLTHRDTYRNHIGPVFGNRDPRSITRSEIHIFLDKLSRVSPQRVAMTMRVLFKEALMIGAVDADPTMGAFTFSAPKKNPTQLSTDTLMRLESAMVAEYEHLKNKDRHPATLRDFYLVMRDSGLRPGEVLALRRMDYVPKTRALSVRGTMTDHISETGGQTSMRADAGKNDSAFRTVILPAHVAGSLSAHEVLSSRLAEEGAPTSPILPSRNNTFISTNNLRTRWRKALRRSAPELYPEDKAGQIHPHLLRHTAASVIVKAAVAKYGHSEGMERARMQLGHSSTRPLSSYLDRTDYPVDNSELFGGTNPVVVLRAQVRRGVQAIASNFDATAELIETGDRLVYAVYRSGGLVGDPEFPRDVEDAIAEIMVKFEGTVEVIPVNDPRTGYDLKDPGTWPGALDFG